MLKHGTWLCWKVFPSTESSIESLSNGGFLYTWVSQIIQVMDFHDFLVGGLEHEFYDFPYIGNSHPNWLIFFRGVETTNQISIETTIVWGTLSRKPPNANVAEFALAISFEPVSSKGCRDMALWCPSNMGKIWIPSVRWLFHLISLYTCIYSLLF